MKSLPCLASPEAAGVRTSAPVQPPPPRREQNPKQGSGALTAGARALEGTRGVGERTGHLESRRGSGLAAAAGSGPAQPGQERGIGPSRGVGERGRPGRGEAPGRGPQQPPSAGRRGSVAAGRAGRMGRGGSAGQGRRGAPLGEPRGSGREPSAAARGD